MTILLATPINAEVGPAGLGKEAVPVEGEGVVEARYPRTVARERSDGAGGRTLGLGRGLS